MHINDKINISVKAMCRVAAKKLLNKSLTNLQEAYAGSLLQAARLVQSMELTDKNDFGDGCHMASTEPSFRFCIQAFQKRVYICLANRYQWEMHHSKESVHIW